LSLLQFDNLRDFAALRDMPLWLFRNSPGAYVAVLPTIETAGGRKGREIIALLQAIQEFAGGGSSIPIRNLVTKPKRSVIPKNAQIFAAFRVA